MFDVLKVSAKETFDASFEEDMQTADVLIVFLGYLSERGYTVGIVEVGRVWSVVLR